MSHAHTPPQRWQAELRAHGYRFTPQRELVLRAIEHLGHATPDEVLTEVRKKSAAVNISTVYRTLEVLEEITLVRHAHLSDRAPTYHPATTPTHAHLVCRECGRVSELPADALAALTSQLEIDYDFTPDLGHLTVFGLCGGCS